MNQESTPFNTPVANETNPYQAGQPTHVNKTNGMAIAGFVFGILSVTLGCLCCPPFFSIPGLIFSMIGRKQIQETGEDGSGMAITGLVLSIISTAFMVLGIVVYIILIAMGIATGDMSDFQ